MTKDSSKKGGFSHHCKRCATSAALTRNYGITLAEYDEMSEACEYRCQICRDTEPTGRRLAVDHCHSTGRIRGLLCMNCNQALGKFKDNVAHLENAIRYLSGTL